MDGKEGKSYGSARAWLVVAAACLVMFTPSYAQMQMSPIAASLMEIYGIGEAQYMGVFTAPNLAPIFLSFIAGVLLDRFGSKKTVLVAISCTFIGCVARILAAGYVPFYCASVLIGIATSFIVTGSAKLMARFFPLEKIGLPIGILYAASSLANLVAAATTVYFPTTTAAFTVSAVVAAAAVLAWAVLVPAESSEELASSQQDQQGQPGQPERGEQPKVSDMLRNVLTCKDVYLVIIANTCLGIMGFTMAGMLPTAMAGRGMEVTDAGFMAAIYSLGMLLGSVLTPAVIAKVNNEKVLLIVLSAVLAVLFPFVMWAPFGPALWLVLIAAGILSYGLVPVYLSLPVRFEKVGVERAGTAGGLIATVQSAGIALLPSTVIIPLANGDYLVLFIIMSILAIVTLLCAVLVKIPKAR